MKNMYRNPKLKAAPKAPANTKQTPSKSPAHVEDKKDGCCPTCGKPMK